MQEREQVFVGSSIMAKVELQFGVSVTAHEKTKHSPQMPYEDSLFFAGYTDPFRFQCGYPLPSYKHSKR